MHVSTLQPFQRVMHERDVMDKGLRSLLQRRLTNQASADLEHLEGLMVGVSFTDDLDQRTCFFEDDSHRMITRVIYQTSTRGEQACPSYSFVWKNFAPPRVKIFGWLLTKDRIHCRTNLVHKHILQDGVCEICKGDDELADHIFSGCPFVRSFWEQIG